MGILCQVRNTRAQARRKAAQAKRLWDEARPIAGTVAETYLRGREITCALPPTLQFHPSAWHGPTSKRYPALVEGSGSFAVHRTYLRAAGLGKAAPDPDKIMLGGVSGGSLTGRGRWWCTRGGGNGPEPCQWASAHLCHHLGSAFHLGPSRAAPATGSGEADHRNRW